MLIMTAAGAFIYTMMQGITRHSQGKRTTPAEYGKMLVGTMGGTTVAKNERPMKRKAEVGSASLERYQHMMEELNCPDVVQKPVNCK